MKRVDALSNTFAALADPTRRAILSRLSGGETSVTELARPFRMTMPAISKHLKVLERAGLIARSRAAQWRPCRLDATRLREASDWVEQYRQFWEQSFDRLDTYLVKVQTMRLPDSDDERPHSRKARHTPPHGATKKEKPT